MTMAGVHRQEGVKVGELKRQRVLLIRLLRNRFGEPSKEIAKKIKTETNLDTLDQWFDLGMTALTIEQVGIS